ncbi:LysM peptidoglycan-binding domain-containing protein [Flavobacterium rhizosphaerae]|uniref:LysM peptidoglycan-binding domain-containing protein n=1 Tax=Flavobacterium rhizosphaerae TaxID=3163298 RepID=A0ABW8YX77_9FLAO
MQILIKRQFFTCISLLCFVLGYSQTDSTEVSIDSVAINEIVADTIVTDTITAHEDIITNTSVLSLLFEKMLLMQDQKAGHINIVHIGDSHIQADLMTNSIRKRLQQRFGNGGAGFSFPHQLAKTNGSYNTRYKSNISWASRRNIYPVDTMEVGLSGIALTAYEDFAVELSVKYTAYNFNTIKIITPGNIPAFDVATSIREIVIESVEPKKIYHTIKSGEVLGSIARKYGVTVTQIKKANGMKSDHIRAGKTLLIPTNEKEKKQLKRSEFIPLELEADSLYHYYHSDADLNKIYLLPAPGKNKFTLSGLVLENDTPGLIYHSIGVNGAKASDYNKYPLFFEQLPALKPDLVIISLGTNESFDKLSAEDYTIQINLFIQNVKSLNPDTAILVITPPPSLFKRKYPNTIVASYAREILMHETEKEYASWDLFTQMGGLYSVPDNAKKGLMSKDRVHYSVDGYEKQGAMFAEAFIKAYDNFKINRE